MSSESKTASRKAHDGEKTIELKIVFWTNNIADDGQILPRHGHTGGVVRMDRNKNHGISPQPPTPFRSLLDLPAKIEAVLLAHGITLHPSPRMAKLLGDKVIRKKRRRSATHS